MQTAVSAGWFDWPALPELFPVSFPGVKTSRDGFLVDTDLHRLKARIADYFDPTLGHEELARRYPPHLQTTSRFDAPAVRESLLARGGPNEDGFMRFAYRPFDHRWLYWEAEGGLLDRPRANYAPQLPGNVWLSVAQHLRKNSEEPQVCCTEHMASLHLIEFGAHMFPAWLRDDSIEDARQRRPNLSNGARRYMADLGLDVEELFYHVLSTLHDPDYRRANAGALRVEWPRIPLPGWRDGTEAAAAQALAASAARGRELAQLLDPDQPVAGVTQGPLRPELANIAVPSKVAGGNMAGDDFAVTAGWGHQGAGGAIMPGPGCQLERRPTASESRTTATHALGATTFDIHLNADAYWRNVPAAVWRYQLGGYQVLKKWLSYREHPILGRPLESDEVQHFTDTARRIAAILLLTFNS